MSRTAHRQRMGVTVAATSLVGITGLSACSSDAPSEGWELEGDRVTVEYPQDWTKGEGADTALLQTFTYEDGGETAHGAWIIASQRQPSASMAVTIGGTAVDKALISQAVDTLRYEHSDEPVPDETEQ